jgi:hypothetical protein
MSPELIGVVGFVVFLVTIFLGMIIALAAVPQEKV